MSVIMLFNPFQEKIICKTRKMMQEKLKKKKCQSRDVKLICLSMSAIAKIKDRQRN